LRVPQRGLTQSYHCVLLKQPDKQKVAKLGAMLKCNELRSDGLEREGDNP